VGIDVEYTLRTVETLALADRYFAPSEAAVLRSLPPLTRNEAFFDYWTLKEAYAKARGMGMSLPFHAFAFDLSVEQPPRISFSPELADDPDDWRFRLWSPTSHHRLAVAVRLRHS
jgi:4'-phosphopantetheinyl transferase